MGTFLILGDGIGIKNHFAARSEAPLFLRCPYFRERVSRLINNGSGLEHRQTSAEKTDRLKEDTRLGFVGYVPERKIVSMLPFMVRQSHHERQP